MNQKFKLKLTENEIMAIIFALSTQREEHFMGSIKQINYRELMDKVSEQTINELEKVHDVNKEKAWEDLKISLRDHEMSMDNAPYHGWSGEFINGYLEAITRVKKDMIKLEGKHHE
jgi:DNA repair protein RadC